MSLAKPLLAVASVAIVVVVMELVLRTVSHPMDLLRPDLVAHPALGWQVAPGSGGHDEWGFRNERVPERVDVVTIGDSQTWGIAAVASENWPAWYARITGLEVYNMGVGGYGPAQYRYLLEHRALSLSPRRIVVGLYLGNDFYDSYNTVSYSDYWDDLRLPSMEHVERGPDWVHPVIVMESKRRDNPVKAVRDWLRVNSMVFRSIEAGPVGELVNAFGDQRAFFSGVGCSLRTSEPFKTIFQPQSRFQGMNLDDPAVTGGIDLTFTFIEQMHAMAASRGIEFHVVVIPTKESVLLRPMEGPLSECEQFAKSIIDAEDVIRARVHAFLEEQGIPFVDVSEAMWRLARRERIFLRSADDHPNGRGYREIAEQIAAVADSSAASQSPP